MVESPWALNPLFHISSAIVPYCSMVKFLICGKWLYRQVISVNGGKYRTNYAANSWWINPTVPFFNGRPSPSGSPEKPQGLAPSLPRTRHLRCVNENMCRSSVKTSGLKCGNQWRSTTANSWVKQHVNLRTCHKCSVFCQEWVASVIQL
jgi:hypothetical protein